MGLTLPLATRAGSVTPVGIDVGDRSVRAAQLRRIGDKYAVTRMGGMQLPEDLSTRTNPQAASKLIGAWLMQMGFRKRECVMGLSTPDIELHAMELPASASPAQTRQAARWEIERLMSFEDGAATIDYWPIPESRQMTSSAIGVAACPTAFETLMPICERAKFRCTRLDATSCALARFGSIFRGPVSQKDVWGVLDLGARQTRLIICVAQVPVLARSFNKGGRKWTDQLADALSISRKAAERHKRDHGIGAAKQQRRKSDSEIASGGPVAEMIYNVLREELGGIVGELERSYKYAIRCFNDRPCGPLLLVGGAASMKNLAELLTSKLGIEVIVPSMESVEPHSQIDFSQLREHVREPLPEYAAAIGLAIDPGDSL
ncbi:MAG TPA: pilus assembly protein PilM [Phycisphaerae bacterium]|nr:pilus assembly protein PilM [Phycisphaerae bacterium]